MPILSQMPPDQPFSIPIYLDLLATFVFALTGSVAAIRRGYDYVGVMMLAALVGAGGGVLRDGLFLQKVPLAVRDTRYLLAVLAACLAGVLFTRARREIHTAMLIIDAIGLGAYSMFGTQASLQAGIPAVGAGLIGLINGCGGGLLRDIAMREEPMLFQPSEHYAGASLLGVVLFLSLDALGASHFTAGMAGLAATTGLRILSMWFGWKTRAFGLVARLWDAPDAEPHDPAGRAK